MEFLSFLYVVLYTLYLISISSANPIAARIPITTGDRVIGPAIAIRTAGPAPVPPPPQRDMEKRAILTGTTTTKVTFTFYSSTLKGGDFIRIVSRTETATANNAGPTPSSTFKYHYLEQMSVDVDIDDSRVPTWKTYSYCKAETSYFMSGPTLNSLWISPVTCNLKVVYPDPKLASPSRCKNTQGAKYYDSAIKASVTPIYDCLIKQNAIKFRKNSKTITRYQKGDFSISRFYDPRDYAWFEACYNGPDLAKKSIPPELPKRDLFVGNGNCPIWDCFPESAFNADPTSFYPGWPEYFAWFGLYNSSAGCSLIAVTRACLLHDSVVFDNV
ncbi:hypothetical protein TWF730_010386 [Orbilia blumenaviensis]|uniref:Uncharacterized protein n=1 Tax=Orbilia blumenaviensis TaxID=1796055 RepID=A0AAV9USL6_9PEZI